MFKQDRNRFGRELMVYMNKGLPYELLNNFFKESIILKIISKDFHQLKGKMMLLEIYKTPAQSFNEIRTESIHP